MPNWSELTDAELENYGQFRRWYGEDEDFYGDYNEIPLAAQDCEAIINQHSIKTDLIHKLNEDAEYGFLKLLGAYWNVFHTNNDGRITNSIEDWWWEASNYM
jgi:hypothetical protein